MEYAPDDMSIRAVVSRLTTGIPEEEWDNSPPLRGTSLPDLAVELTSRPAGVTVEELMAAYTQAHTGRECVRQSAYVALLRTRARVEKERSPNTRKWVNRYFL